jgi:isopenicillin N synthase-like dioxygenase
VHDPPASATAPDPLPIVDIGPAIEVGADADCRLEVAQRLVEVYRVHGFGYIRGHGIPDELQAEVFSASQRFHDLGEDRKREIELDENHRGYIAPQTSTDRNSSVDRVTKPNRSSSFMMLRECAPDDPDVVAGVFLAGPNQWPAGLPGFRETLERYHAAMTDLGRRTIELFEVGLGVTDGSMARSFDRPTTWLRLLRYPPAEPGLDPDAFGSAPHRDFGALTFLAQDAVGGLEVRTVDGRWVPVSPLAGTFVMNVGDMLHRWSNGLLLSTPHRVRNESRRPRFSIPFFFDPHVETVIAPVRSCIEPGDDPAFPPIHFGSFLRAELGSSYDRHRARDSD